MTPDIYARETVLSILDNFNCKHEKASDIDHFPMLLQQYLLSKGYIEYDTANGNLGYMWAEGALDILNNEPEALPEAKKQQSVKKYIRGGYGIDLSLEIQATTNPSMITVIPVASREGVSHRFSNYDIFLYPDRNDDTRHEISVRDRESADTHRLMCIHGAERHDADTTNVWEQEDEASFMCERLGVHVYVSDSLKTDNDDSLRIILTTRDENGQYTDTTLLALTTSGFDNCPIGFAQVREMLSFENPVRDMHEQRHIFSFNK